MRTYWEIYYAEFRSWRLKVLCGICADMPEFRFNPNHDPKNGRFTSGSDSTSSKGLTSGGKSNIINSKILSSYANQSDKSLKSGIKSELKQIYRHKDKILNPQKYIPDWNSKNSFYKEGVIRHWKKEIENFEKQINLRQDELNRREK